MIKRKGEKEVARRYQISVRKTNGLEIWFVSPRDIYIKDRYGWRVFTRWDVRRSMFWTRHWNPFRRALRHNRYLDMSYIYSLATLHEISVRSGRLPSWIDESRVRIIPEKGRTRNNERFHDRSGH